MSTSNLIIHTGNYFKLEDIHYVKMAYFSNPTWSDVSNFQVTEDRDFIKAEDSDTRWSYSTDANKDTSFKFNVIALFKEENPDFFEEGIFKPYEEKIEGGVIIKVPKEGSIKSLLAYGNYKSNQLVNLSDNWVIDITSNWTFTDDSTTDPSKEFELMYNYHTVTTNPDMGLDIHSKLLNSYALPATKAIHNLVTIYQSRGIDINASGSGIVDSIYGVNIIDYNSQENDLIPIANNKSNKSAQWLILNKFGPGYEDVIALYDDYEGLMLNGTKGELLKDYKLKRITKLNYNEVNQ